MNLLDPVHWASTVPAQNMGTFLTRSPLCDAPIHVTRTTDCYYGNIRKENQRKNKLSILLCLSGEYPARLLGI